MNGDSSANRVNGTGTGPGGVRGDVPDRFDDERARLEAELAAAHTRTQAATERARVLDAEVKAAVRAELEQAREELAELERLHHDEIARLREATAAEVDRLLADGRPGVDPLVATDGPDDDGPG